MNYAHAFRIALLILTLQPVAGLMACQFDPPGMSHEQWVKWVEDRNKTNDEMMKQKAEGTLAQAKVKKPEAGATGANQRVRRSYAGDRRTTAGGAVNNVINLRR